MKKIKYIILLCTSVFLLSGCVKFNANMNIKKDKSMNFSIIYAVNSTLLDDQELLTDEEKKNIEKQGFIFEDYKEDNMKGFKIIKNIKNIDSISSKNDEEYSLSGIMNNTSEENYMFKVEKGFFKNTYTANFKFDASDSGLSDDLQDPTLDDDNYNDELENEEDTLDSNTDDDFDFTELMGNLDLSFNVTLSNNASKTENNDKKLSWNLSNDELQNIEFKFELYNMTNIYICVGIGIGILIIGVIVAITIITKNKGNKKDKNNSSNTQINQPVNQNTTYQQPIVNPIDTQANTINNGNISSSMPLNNNNQVSNTNIVNPIDTQTSTINNGNISSSMPLDNNNQVSNTNIVNPIGTQANTINNENISSSMPLDNNNQVSNINTNNLNTIPEQQNTNTTDIFNTSVNQTSTPNINNQNNNPFNNGTM